MILISVIFVAAGADCYQFLHDESVIDGAILPKCFIIAIIEGWNIFDWLLGKDLPKQSQEEEEEKETLAFQWGLLSTENQR